MSHRPDTRTTRMVRRAAIFGIVTLILAYPATDTGAQGATMRRYQLQAAGDHVRMVLSDVPTPTPGRDEVLVRMRAASLNRRDLSSAFPIT